VIKVALIQRICPHYRVPVWRKLARADGVEVTVYFGRGEQTGSQQNAKDISVFRYKQLFTLSFPFHFGKRTILAAFHPSLLFHLWKNRYKVVICEGSSNLIDNLFIVPYCLLMGIPFIWWDAGRKADARRRFLRRLFDPILKFCIRKSSACIAYNSIAYTYLRSAGASPEKVFIAQNTVDTNRICEDLRRYDEKIIVEERKALDIEDKKVILYVGALEKRKKLNILIDAFADVKAELRATALLVVGDGPYQKKIKKYVKDSGVADVQFFGRIVEGVGLFYLLSDVVVLPGWATLAVPESMAYGTPVIAPQFGGPEYELIIDGENGFIFEKDNVEDLSYKIRLVLTEESIASVMSEKARNLMRQKYTLDNMVRGIVEAIDYSISNTGRKGQHKTFENF
jgi:glycosyltransferase involved in cell wall biosynthesis